MYANMIDNNIADRYGWMMIRDKIIIPINNIIRKYLA